MACDRDGGGKKRQNACLEHYLSKKSCGLQTKRIAVCLCSLSAPRTQRCRWQEVAFPSFSRLFSPEISCRCPSAMPLTSTPRQGHLLCLVMDGPFLTLFWAVKVVEIIRGKYLMQAWCIEFCQVLGARLPHAVFDPGNCCSRIDILVPKHDRGM